MSLKSISDINTASLKASVERFLSEGGAPTPFGCEGGWFTYHHTDRYFARSVATLNLDERDPVVTMQAFAKKDGLVCGIAEVLSLMATSGLSDRREDIDILALPDGARIEPWEAVMVIRAPYKLIGPWETIIDGILARRTLVATNTSRCVTAAKGVPVAYFGARHDDYRVQAGDGYAALTAGASGVSTDAGGSWLGEPGMGTMPHALIACYDGDTVAATLAFARYMIEREQTTEGIVSLVDYGNNVIDTSLDVCKAMEAEFGPGVLSGVRLDTSGKLIDYGLIGDKKWGREDLTGVNPRLVEKLRQHLDSSGYNDVDIFVSGGFTPNKIRKFAQAPVDGFGVGSGILGHGDENSGIETGFDFTIDVVRVNGKLESKAGRRVLSQKRLGRFNFEWFN